MGSTPERRYSVGASLDDHCRPCRLVRRHTVMVVDGNGAPLRVICDYCGSQHNYRGGAAPARSSAPFEPVAERERSVAMEGPRPATAEAAELELLLRRIIREEAGLTPVAPAEKWRGGELVLRPGRPGVQEKSWPIETFFHKVVMLRNRLRVLEQQINGADLPADAKLKLQGYVTACYGSLTSFNVLFADESDRFRGSGGGA